MLGDERLELWHEVAVTSAGEISGDPVLDDRQPQLLEPPDLLREREVVDVLERRSAPQSQRFRQPS